MSIYAITAVSVERPCRIRLYENEDAEFNDFGRPSTQPPTGQHGVVFDVNIEAGMPFRWSMTPIVLTAHNPETCKLLIEPPTKVYIHAERLS